MFFGGRYTDTNRDFLKAINQPLHFVIIFVVIGSVVSKLLQGTIKLGTIAAKEQSSIMQSQLDKAYSGLDFDMPLRLGQHLAFLTVVLFYCTAIPDLLIIGFIYFVLHFWLDKLALIRNT